MELAYIITDSPVGQLKLVANEHGLVAVLWEQDFIDSARPDRVRLGAMKADPQHAILAETAKQLEEYFSGSRCEFDLPLDLQGTDFQRAVWGALREIDFGETSTYTRVAQRLQRPEAVRAVGAAIGRNPVSIVVPCHRVLGASGSLTGFAGGLEKKAALLALEGRQRMLYAS